MSAVYISITSFTLLENCLKNEYEMGITFNSVVLAYLYLTTIK